MQDKIMDDLKTAMKAGEKEKVETLRMVKTALQMAAIDAKGDLSEDAQIKVLQKESKKRKEAAVMFEQGGNGEQAAKERAEAELIDQYLPEQMSEEDIAKIVDEVIAEVGSENMGAVMGPVMAKVAGQADGSIVSRIVREKLQ